MEILSARGIFVISDECYLRFVYPPHEVFSAAVCQLSCAAVSVSPVLFQDLRDDWMAPRICAGAARMDQGVLNVQDIQQQPKPIAQYAAAEALNGPQDSVATMLAEYQARRAWMLDALKDVPGFTCNEPEGAFYVFPKVAGCLKKLKSSAEFAEKLLEEEQTVVTDGAGFGSEGYVRISYATSMAQLRKA